MNVQGLSSTVRLAQSLTDISKLPQKLQQQQMKMTDKLLKVSVQSQVQATQNQTRVDLLA